MASTSLPQPPTQRDLLRCWRRWVGIVEHHAYRKRNVGAVDHFGYDSLYQTLMVGCAPFRRVTLGRRSVDGPRIAEVVRPWVSLRSLAGADRMILFDLLRTCRAIDAELGRKRLPARRLVGVLAVLALAAGSFQLASRPDSAAPLAGVVRNLRLLARHADDPPMMVAFVAAIVVAAIAAVSTGSRR